jgi:hypothetical protein
LFAITAWCGQSVSKAQKILLPLLLVPVWKDWEESAGLVAPKWFLHEGGREEGFHGAGSWKGRTFITFISIKNVEEAFLFTRSGV